MKLFTSRYQNRAGIKASGCTAVGITLGRPRFTLGYDLVYFRLLAPTPSLFHVHDREKFIEIYRLQLERTGVDQIHRQLTAISLAHDETDLVLLCFEDLTKPGTWCHRRVFADWWQGATNEVVAELPAVGPARL